MTISRKSAFVRVLRLPAADRRLLVETIWALAVASLAIRVLPFRRLMLSLPRIASGPAPDPAADAAEIARIKWAVNACSRRLPWRIVCFQKGLAVYKLLHRRGIPAIVHYGVAPDGDSALKAHVWVTHRGEAVIGGEEAPNHPCLATFPAQAS